ncbi:PfkB family carbohydrate kinase [Paenarthrobacter sp. TYUT067]|uniref:PfkB family carbohydrate kinase n=1 Tax=Paenarthrobacter sp. TYUT067 TaxID=2926245 RepID=UPI0027E0AC18|nr:PfkB family carbohydrate kinase [Paenarthrobacter sp. TYUT067]
MPTRTGAGRENLDVIVVGESLIDIITTAGGQVEFAGGSGLNVAFWLGRLGVNTRLLTVLGTDQRGETIRRHLESAGVQLLPGAVRLARTSSADASLDSKGSAHYTFDIEWTMPAATPKFIPTVLHTGSLDTFLGPVATDVPALVQSLTGRCLITYDSNIRPDIIPLPRTADLRRHVPPGRRGKA